MRLEKFIVDLLYQHDCVIVPGFGGLVANYRSARLNKSAHIIHPPSKHVGFNRHLLQNDGLLANAVSITAGLSYKEAISLIEEKVSEYKKSLSSGGRIVWEKVGIFFNDQQGHLQFIPEEQENFLLDSYGFTSLQLTPVKRVIVAPKAEEPVPEPLVIEPKIATIKTTSPAWKIAAIIGGPIVLGLALWLSAGVMKKDIQWASLNPFQTGHVISGYKMITPTAGPEYPIASEVTGWERAKESMPGAESITFNFLEDKPADIGIEVKLAPLVKTPAESTATKFDAPKVISAESKKYKVIGGAFSVMENAEKLVSELKSSGFEAHLAGKKGSLTLVAFGSFSSQEEARELLSKLRAEGRNAWLLSK